MKDKFVNVFFSTVSLVCWAATISAIVFAFVLLFTGMKKPPQFTLNEASLRPAAAEEISGLEGKGGNDWYCLTLKMTVSAAKHSPYSYKADGFALEAPEEIAAGDEWFSSLDEPLDYSKLEPDDFTLRLFVRSPEGEEALRARLPEFRFGMRGLTGYFTFIRCPIKTPVHGFSLSDFSAVVLRPADAAA